jgi:outer membrane biosynthesis protein TonB
MFEDFDKSSAPREGRGRMGVSLLVSAGLFIGGMALLATAVATARVVIKRQQRDVAVSFADLPPPPPRPKPKAAPKRPAAPGKRRAAVRQVLRPPTEIPAERPAEAEGELAEAGATGPIEGFTDGSGEGGGGGSGPRAAPEQRIERVEEPRFLSGCRTPEVPEALVATAATIHVDVRMLIDAAGRVTSVSVLKAHPLVPDDLVLSCARAQRFAPAHLPDGTPVPYPFRRRFVFKPTDA